MERRESECSTSFSIDSILASTSSKSPSGAEESPPAVVSSRESLHDHREMEEMGTGQKADLPRRDYPFAPAAAPFSPGHWYPWLHANAFLHYAYESKYTEHFKFSLNFVFNLYIKINIKKNTLKTLNSFLTSISLGFVLNC